MKTNSGKKGEGMPVVRNPQFYFKEGFCWTDINSTFLKARIKDKGVFDVVSMTLFTQISLPDWYFVCLINTYLMSLYVDNFINNTSHFQINDARQTPIIIPTKETIKRLSRIFLNAQDAQKQLFSHSISLDVANNILAKSQKELENIVNGLYSI